MPISEFEIKRIEKYVGKYIKEKRPPIEIRDQLDLAFRISGQSFEIFEIRPQFQKPDVKTEHPVAKATYVKTRKIWELFWMRADLKWHSYKPFPSSTSLEEIIDVIDQDTHSCFWG